MDKLLIRGQVGGQKKLSGEVHISAAKNACLPLMTACLLSPRPIEFLGIPNLQDLNTLRKLLKGMGVTVQDEGNSCRLNASYISVREADYDLVRTMRASILVLGPLLARFGEAKVSLPGGCAIGTRPIDIHLEGMKKLGAEIRLHAGYVEASAKKLIGAAIILPFPSVGATENLMMAAALAEGVTTISNAAREPEIENLGQLLQAMGVKVEGAGQSVITIHGVREDELKEVRGFRPIGDRIEAATYIMAGLITNSSITVRGFVPEHLQAVLEELKKMGANLELLADGVKVSEHVGLKGCTLDTAPYPGFPTDAQAQIMALACVANGPSMIREQIFENRFMHVQELERLGAKTVIKGNLVMVEGNSHLVGAPVMCTDLRASAALVLAALVAEGETLINRIYHLDRGYENLEGKLRGLGADVTRIK